MESIVVSRLFVYPVKSLGGVELSSAKVLPKGLAFDRRWMLVDEQNRFLTQREVHRMSLVKTFLHAGTGQVGLQYSGETILLPEAMKGECLTATVWNDSVEVVRIDEEIDGWLSQHLDISCKLVGFPEDNMRPVDPDYAINPTDQTNLSDGYPVLLLGQSSLDDLNARLSERVGLERFRPNIVFAGGVPFEEDGWKRFSVGGVPMAGVKPCGRCIVTTINQQTGEAGKEPLATLSSYRKIGNKVLFGQNVIPLGTGVIKVGDEIILQ